MNIILSSWTRTSVFAASAVLLLASPLITSAWTTTTPSGAQTYGTPGSYDFIVPENAGDITVEVWGGGGGGSGGHWTQSIFGQDMSTLTGRTGGVSTFNTNLIANGGTGGIGSNNGGWYWLVFVPAQGGAGGTASGGDLNLAGGNGTYQQGGAGAGPGGGAGGTIASKNGQPAGGGGGGGPDGNFAGGGGGGYTKKVYAAGTLTAGAHIPVQVGVGGASIDPANTGSGAPGTVKITWTGQTVNDPEPQPQASAFTQSTTATQDPSVGGTDTITATIKNIGGTTNALIDIEVYQNGTKVGQKFFDNQSFNTNESHTYTYPFTVPSAGAYTVSIGVFHAGWAGMHTWFDQVASFTAASGGGGGQALSIYQDALAQGWENWSWGSTQNFSDASLVFSGTRAMKVTYNAPWGGLFLHHAGVNTTGKSTLNFAIAGGGAGGQNLQIYTSDSNGTQSLAKNLSQYISGGIAANTWKQVSIPLADIGAANKTLSGIVIQDISGTIGASIYIDAMQIQ